MSIQKKNNQKMLLEALDYVDVKYVDELVDGLRLPKESAAPSAKRSFRASVKYAALIAACALLLGAAIPVAGTLIRNITSGTAAAGEVSLNYTSPYGEVPEEFKHIVEQNLFNKVTVYGDRLIKEDFNNETDLVTIELLNYSGETVAVLDFSSLTYGHLDKILMTDGGKFLAVFGKGPVHPDPYVTYYPPARIIEFDKNGKLLNESTFEALKPSALKYIFPTSDGYLFVGSMEKENTRTYSNVIIGSLDKFMNITSQLILGEENAHNDLSFASFIDGKLNVYNRSLIDTGEGVLKRKEEFRKLTFDSKLNLIDETISDEYFDYSSEITRDEDYYAYYDKADLEKASSFELIRYEKFDLVVARFHSAADYEFDFSNFSDPLSLYYETVYSAFSENGELLWRASADGTDYELLAVIQANYEENMSKYGAESKQPIEILKLTDEALAQLLDMMLESDREEILASLSEERRAKVIALMSDMTTTE